jgi:transcriptional regulator with XRE-family HTH domain
MPSAQLPNYLLAHRKRSGLSQAEIAFLLGNEGGETVCRHECFEREPSLRTALSYEAIYQKHARELFPGVYREIEEQVAKRAKTLTSRMDLQKDNQHTDQKRQALAMIEDTAAEKSENVQ